MPRYKLTLEYDGTTLVGWQTQDHGASVQSLLQDAIYKFCGHRVSAMAAGRTDAGVHADAMTAHFDIPNDADNDTVMRALNFYLVGKPIAVLNCERVGEDFHSRFSCTRRNYRYVILNRAAPVVLDKNKVWWIPRPLDISAIKAAAAQLIGRHDFTSFRASECQAKSPVKTLDSANVKQDGDKIILEFSAKSFLHHQVRNMVGTLVEIGLGKPLDMEKIFAAKSRSAAGPTAPASGLYFVSADY
ncbi:MAG: tRNA pseudouridine(38-40) synthase TruA [Rickettsiales bacterium]|jgi:tRNA pseudouridine38-40 synthase|nr:tRNA pseudouridine(38-40) synthase TruA [Rickettsiales bacterium]